MGIIDSASVGFFTIGGYDVLGSRDNIEADVVSVSKERTPIGQRPAAHDFVGVEKATITHSGWMDTATGSIVDALLKSNRSRTSQIVTLGNEGNALGAGCLCAAGALTGSYTRGVAVEEFTRVSGQMNLSGAIDDQSLILAPLTARTDATWSTTAVDHGSSSAAGLAAYLIITSLTLGGYDSVDILVEHSADGVTWATLVAFTVATDVGGERKSVAAGGTINRRLRVSASYSGTGTGQSVTALVCAERY